MLVCKQNNQIMPQPIATISFHYNHASRKEIHLRDALSRPTGYVYKQKRTQTLVKINNGKSYM